ncbi:MAG: glycosyltransferase family 2 protein [Planctomycetes bacterium]|nr:glycosyltransferase family 2 protein [Planctomycetota bacterium]
MPPAGTELRPEPAFALSIVTVTWNAPDYVARMIDSVYARTRVPFELIVVDNASEAPTRSLLAGESAKGRIRLFQNEENSLWAKGCNQGIRAADPRSPYVLLLNPDCEILRDDWFDRLRAVLDADPKVAVTGPFLNWKRIGPTYGCVDGSVFFVRREALDQVGMLDADRFPWNGSPYDWTARAFAKGWIYRRVSNEPEFVVHHSHKSVEASGREMPWNPVDVEDMIRRAGLAPARVHRLSAWMRRTLGPAYFFEPR